MTELSEWFERYPSKVLGRQSRKKRGDRGPDAYEDIVEGSMENALAMLVSDSGISAAYFDELADLASGNENAERLRLLAISIEIELELAAAEMELEL